MTLVTLNVGGVEYATTATTLRRYPQSMLARMWEGELPPANKDSKGRCATGTDPSNPDKALHHRVFIKAGVRSFRSDIDTA